MGVSGDTHQKGEHVIALIDHQGSVLAPVPVAPVKETAMGLFPEGLKALQEVAQEGGWDLRGASLHLDGGCDAAHHRPGICTAGLSPNIPETARHRKRPKRGRQRWCTAALQT